MGAASARIFAREGAKLIVTGRRREPVAPVAAEIGDMASAGDTRDVAHSTVAAAVATFGGLDIVVASAGLAFIGSVGDTSDTNSRSIACVISFSEKQPNQQT